jgi:hypothetical protein
VNVTPERAERLQQHMAEWVLSISKVIVDEFPEDQRDEALGTVLGMAIEHMMMSGVAGQIVNRIRFVEAINAYGGRDWVLKYVDPERYADAE